MSASREVLQRQLDNPDVDRDDYPGRAGWFKSIARAALTDLGRREERIAALERELEQLRHQEALLLARLRKAHRHTPEALDEAQIREDEPPSPHYRSGWCPS